MQSYHTGGKTAMARAVALLVAGLLQLVASQRTLLPDNHESQALRSAAASVLAAHTPCLHTTVFVTDAAEGGEMLQAPRGLAVLREVDGGKVRGNTSKTYLGHMAENIHQMGGAWHCLVVVVVSDDPAFLAAFAHLSLRRHALRWSTRILVLTRLPLSHLGGLHDLLSNRNAMLLHVQEGEEAARKVNVLVWQPYSTPSSTPLRVATWTTHGRLTLISHVPLFPDKFSVLVNL
ncbi:uncharacterized protein LOC123511966 [Portunus trituberculatus]|uniref:uncharacterized protein LOC123511966 n=1 Tax=Portunus trituberculatus TaxID=210409 RepID=UPI001E1CDDA0|nr:uncharacterized protein LOC123511966 [Portunus trituberculatus]